jgi:hypothetical protein
LLHLRSKQGTENLTRGLAFQHPGTRRQRIAALIGARPKNTLLGAARCCRTARALRALIHRVAAAGAGQLPGVSAERAGILALSHHLDEALGTSVNWADLVRDSIPMARVGRNYEETATHILGDLLLAVLHSHTGVETGLSDNLPSIDSQELIHDPEAAVRRFVQADWRMNLKRWQQQSRTRNFGWEENTQGGTRGDEASQVPDYRAPAEARFDVEKWEVLKNEFREQLVSGIRDPHLADAAIKIFEIRARNVEKGYFETSQPVPDNPDQSARQVVDLLRAPATSHWESHTKRFGLSRDETARLLRYVHMVAGRFAQRHRGERVADLIYRLFSPAYFQALEESFVEIPVERAGPKLPQDFNAKRAERLVLQYGFAGAAKRLRVSPEALRLWHESVSQAPKRPGMR